LNYQTGTRNRRKPVVQQQKKAPLVKKFGFAALAASGLAGALIGLATPAAASTGPGHTQDTINVTTVNDKAVYLDVK
jgi:hypothetical protein